MAQKRKAGETGGSVEVAAVLKTSSLGIRFHLSGRADVVSPAGVWEVKTCSPMRDAPARSHLLQLYFYMKALGIDSGRLLYVNPEDGEERELPLETAALARLWRTFLRGAARLVRREWDHHRTLEEHIGEFAFPFPEYRPGQRELAGAVTVSVESAGETMIQAPTGTGKTAAVLFGAVKPAVEAWNTIFFLTAKNTQKKLALETGGLFRAAGLPLRAVALSSKKDSCPMDSDRCSPDNCPLAEVFADRIADSGLLEDLLELGMVDTKTLVDRASAAGVCPFETGLCLAQRCDLVICDYNHVFDPSASLKRFFAEEETAARIDLLVDEAANLPDRVARIWSPEIRESWLKRTALHAGKTGDRKMKGLIRPWTKMLKAAGELLQGEETDDLPLPGDLSPPRVDARRWKRILRASPEPPIETLDLWRAVVRFSLVADRSDGPFHLLARREKGETVVQWFCSNPSDLSAEVHGRCRSVTAFSATLSPASHFRPLLGFRKDSGWTGTGWPFPRENLRVWIDSTIDTRWKARAESTGRVAERIASACRKTPGTWLVWFPSFSWMEEVAERLAECSPLVQPRITTPGEREEFLSSASAGGRLVLTVAGGLFSEGVDMSFPDLRGGFAVGPFLPTVNTRRELVRAGYDTLRSDGFLHAYVIPGMNRVIQAAGRLVRNPEQKADLVLLGRRFTREPYAGLLPEHWMPARVITRRGVSIMKGGRL